MDGESTEQAGFHVFSNIRPNHTYHVIVRSKKVKQEWLKKIEEVMKFHAELIKMVSFMQLRERDVTYTLYSGTSL